MNPEAIHLGVERLRAASGQRLALGALATTAATGASLLTTFGAAAGTGEIGVGVSAGVAVVVLVLAIASVAAPDSPLAMLVLVALLLGWCLANGDPTTWWSLPVTAGALTFHLLISLLATAPSSAVFDASILRRWTSRAGGPAAAALVVWGLAVALDGREVLGAAAVLTSLLVLTVAALLIGPRPTAPPGRPR